MSGEGRAIFFFFFFFFNGDYFTLVGRQKAAFWKVEPGALTASFGVASNLCPRPFLNFLACFGFDFDFCFVLFCSVEITYFFKS